MIRNRKGASLIIVLVSILIMTMIIPSILMNPIQIKRKEKDINNDLIKSKDLSQLSSYITKDIISSNYNIEKNSKKSLQIGNNSYDFAKGVKRNNVKISNTKCGFEIKNDFLEVKCENITLLFPLIPNTNSIKEVI